MKKMKTKGQSALEASFVILFLIIAVGSILGKTNEYGRKIDVMAEARAQAQGVALEQSMLGRDTYVVRVDPIPRTGGPITGITVFYVSTGCTSSETDACADSETIDDAMADAFRDAIREIDDELDVNTCCRSPYTDRKFPQST